ncbi:Alpha/Beta hydrolase protein [Triangularia verruculosa]|uniref:Alpha/Beta hydrolase protein n=1 Tax=Triangularia verruculosa TaxID=2587418 RepID=A0AAN6XB02_9PEZI|nr:Alpha/Beta hydrolase protein [Triangularia verruculosa]
MSQQRLTKVGSSQSRLSSMLNPEIAAGLSVGLIFGVPVAVYALFLGLSSIPFFQRQFLYAHKFHSLWWPGARKKINQPQRYGFAKNQATPFLLRTPDNESLYAWHILPLTLYNQHTSTLGSRPDQGICHKDFTRTQQIDLLRNDPDAKVVVSFHGNAGHLLQSHRPRVYHTLSLNHHIFSLSYRGFGLSTGYPTEAGLTTDAIALIDFLFNECHIPPHRIVLLGQSLGTAVVAAVTHHFAINHQIDFAGSVIVAGFSSLPTMLSGYSIAGFIPVLRPLSWWPWLLKVVMGRVVDRWESAARWKQVTREVKQRKGRLRLEMVHAKNDWDIPAHEDDKVFRAAVGGVVDDKLTEGNIEEMKEDKMVGDRKEGFSVEWMEEGVVIRQELVPFGGHNDVTFYAPTFLAIMRSFEGVRNNDGTL